MPEVVLDASAALALIKGEPGAETVSQQVPGAHISAVNLAEVVGHLVDHGASLTDLTAVLERLGLIVASCDRASAVDIGLLRSETRRSGLSLGDRACLALARRLGFPALTADKAWSSLDLDVEIRLIR